MDDLLVRARIDLALVSVSPKFFRICDSVSHPSRCSSSVEETFEAEKETFMAVASWPTESHSTKRRTLSDLHLLLPASAQARQISGGGFRASFFVSMLRT